MAEAERRLGFGLEQDVDLLDEQPVVGVSVPLGQLRGQVGLEVFEFRVVYSENCASMNAKEVVSGDGTSSPRRQMIEDR